MSGNNSTAYDKIYRNISTYNPDFIKHQEIGAKRIAKIIDEIDCFSGKNDINCIIDVGCGRGEILQLISKHCDRIKLAIGVDVCQTAINAANKKTPNSKSSSDITYIHRCGNYSDILTSDFFTAIKKFGPDKKMKFDRNAAIVTCLGHTVFHTNVDEFIKWLTGIGVPFALVDWHTTWDSALKNAKDGKPYFEPIREHKNGILGMLTKNASDGELVERGLARYNTNGAHRWVCPPTQQFPVTSSEFKKKMRDNHLYRLDEHEYLTGFGHKRVAVFYQSSRFVNTLNNIHYKIVCDNLLPFMMTGKLPNIDQQRLSTTQNIRHLLSNFDALAIAAIPSFDPHLSFARFIVLNDTNADDDVSKLCMFNNDDANREDVTLLLHHFPSDRNGRDFVTADRLFQCLLDNPGGCLFVDPTTKKNLRSLLPEIDEEFSKKGQDKHITRISKSFGVKNKRSRNTSSIPYLIIPIYFGSFPLAVIIGRLSDHAPNLDKDYWTAIALSLHSEMTKNVSPKILQERYVEPLLATARAKSSIFDDIVQLKKAISWAYNKPWKSWLQIFPEIDIKTLDQEKRKNMLLTNVWKNSCDAYCSGRWYVSKKLQEIEFFVHKTEETEEDSSHEKFTDAHKRALAEVICNAPSCTLFSDIANCLNAQKWFGPFCDDPYVSFFIDKLNLGDNDEQKANAFKCLKSVFCRTSHNTGSEFRFSLKGIACLITIHTNLNETILAPQADIAKPFVISRNNPEYRILSFLLELERFSKVLAINHIDLKMNEYSSKLAHKYISDECSHYANAYIITLVLNCSHDVFTQRTAATGGTGDHLVGLIERLQADLTIFTKASGNKLNISFVVASSGTPEKADGLVKFTQDVYCLCLSDLTTDTQNAALNIHR